MQRVFHGDNTRSKISKVFHHAIQLHGGASLQCHVLGGMSKQRVISQLNTSIIFLVAYQQLYGICSFFNKRRNKACIINAHTESGARRAHAHVPCQFVDAFSPGPCQGFKAGPVLIINFYSHVSAGYAVFKIIQDYGFFGRIAAHKSTGAGKRSAKMPVTQWHRARRKQRSIGINNFGSKFSQRRNIIHYHDSPAVSGEHQILCAAVDLYIAHSNGRHLGCKRSP